MATGAHWQDPIGLETIQTIVKKIIPTWTDGLHLVQLKLISAILDGRDILCCTATGDGKSAAFAVPGLVLLEYNAHPDAYPAGLPTRKRPIGVLITPTKGLANNIVYELSKLNVSAFSYCHETLSEARKAGTRLSDVIKECIRWQVICVDPEHLRDKEWREITESPIFRSNVLFGCINEVHLINVCQWGLSFRTVFTTIGAFLRGRFPALISVVGLTATLEPGSSTISVCKSLGFFEGNFKFIRGNLIRQMERHSDGHRYRPHSSYFPLDVSSSILDHLLVIHFPSHLEDLIGNSWIYYSTHGTALYDSIIDIQMRINVGRTNSRELAKSKRREKQRTATVDEDENETDSVDIEPREPIDQISSEQQGLSRKREAMEEIANRPKRRRAPRAPQPSVAQEQEHYGPRYQTRRRGPIENPSRAKGKENDIQRVNLK